MFSLIKHFWLLLTLGWKIWREIGKYGLDLRNLNIALKYHDFSDLMIGPILDTAGQENSLPFLPDWHLSLWDIIKLLNIQPTKPALKLLALSGYLEPEEKIDNLVSFHCRLIKHKSVRLLNLAHSLSESESQPASLRSLLIFVSAYPELVKKFELIALSSFIDEKISNARLLHGFKIFYRQGKLWLDTVDLSGFTKNNQRYLVIHSFNSFF